mmetsp:Transcript_58/g.166  ORF Transcript_58/g.166 Transcript_58/m.166 type:complete len:239 (+) Transcript_58:334-1050(+)
MLAHETVRLRGPGGDRVVSPVREAGVSKQHGSAVPIAVEPGAEVVPRGPAAVGVGGTGSRDLEQQVAGHVGGDVVVALGPAVLPAGAHVEEVEPRAARPQCDVGPGMDLKVVQRTRPSDRRPTAGVVRGRDWDWFIHASPVPWIAALLPSRRFGSSIQHQPFQVIPKSNYVAKDSSVVADEPLEPEVRRDIVSHRNRLFSPVHGIGNDCVGEWELVHIRCFVICSIKRSLPPTTSVGC